MSEIRTGQLLAKRYRAMQRIGKGGFGEVWKAEDQSLRRKVALKVVSGQRVERQRQSQYREFVERFKREARILAALKHIHIMSLFDYGESDGLRYLVMPLHEGGTLADRLRRGPLTLDEVDHYFTQLAEALDYAHKEKIVHRDLKPSNALLDQNNNVLLSDFGISKLIEDGSELTLSGTTIGTPDYMSPEQFKGLPVDQRSDLYALGIILYQMLTGRTPFEADNKWALAQKHLTDFASRPSTFNTTLTSEIDDVVMKALAKDPAERFASAAEMLSAWKIALGQPDVARSVAPTTRLDTPSAQTLLSRTVRQLFNLPPVVLVGAAVGMVLFACLAISITTWGLNSFTTFDDLPRLNGSTTVSGLTAQAQSAIGAKTIVVTLENKNPQTYSVQISASSGQAKAALLSQPSGIKFPIKPEKDFIVLKPNQKESLTLNFDSLINANDTLTFQWIAAEVGGTVTLTIPLIYKP